jgi:hypothetical protein
MKNLLLSISTALVFLLLQIIPGHAQATRTWVSGVGDGANPCSRTAPCKTFAGAISKTAASGEINCLDPGGFGAVTITKAITISCESVEAGVLVAGTNGIIVSAGAISSSGQGSDITLAYSNVNGNTTGVSFTAPAEFRTYQTSQVRGNNVTNGTFSSTIPLE